jgi:hypothetical protein
VEDLVKKLPGAEVDKDGNIKHQGEQIQKVYVDGKEFFGNDPKLATKNLTADMVESIQVYDDMSDQAKFTKIDDGSRTKAMNIKLKKDRNKGIFGRALAAYGSSDRYEGNVSFNKFDGPQRISVLFNGNNINKQGFSFSDIISSMGGFSGFNGGGGGGGFGGGQMISLRGGGGGGGFGGGGGNFGSSPTGIIKSISAGVNYTDDWTSKIKATGSYFFSDADNVQQQTSFRKTTYAYADSVANRDANTYSRNKNQNHRINFRIEGQIDSMSSILYTPSITLQHSSNNNTDISSTMVDYRDNEYPALIDTSNRSNARDGINWNNNPLYRRRNRKDAHLRLVNTYGQSEQRLYDESH